MAYVSVESRSNQLVRLGDAVGEVHAELPVGFETDPCSQIQECKRSNSGFTPGE